MPKRKNNLHKGPNKDKVIAKLRAEIVMLKNIIHLMPGNLYWKNTKNIYLGCNNNMAKILNFKSPDEIIGLDTLQAAGEKLGEYITKNDNEVMASKKELHLEEPGFDSTAYITLKAPLFNRQRKVTGLVGISLDITDRKRAEEKLKIAKRKAEVANKAKSRFLAMMTHELRTPLTSILGFANFLEREQLTLEKEKEYLKHIVQSGSYLLSLINNLLDYSRLENNKLEITFFPLNLKKLSENTIHMLTGTAKSKNIALLFDYDPSLPEYLIGDDRALQQILINFIGNAIKFTEKGHVALKIKCLNTTHAAVELQIAIEDTGIGIPLQEQKSIFNRFYQTGSIYTRKRSLVGTGLGLAIVKKLAQLMKAKIKVKSKPNHGSTFYFTVTLQKVAVENSHWLPYAATVKILVIKDHRDIKESDFRKALVDTNYSLVSSNKAVSLLSRVNNPTYDIIIIATDTRRPASEKLLQLIKPQQEHHKCLLILLEKNVSSQNQNNQSYDAIFTASDLEPLIFQEKLKSAWENWQQKLKMPKIEVNQSNKPHILLIEDDLLIQIIHKKMLQDLGCVVDIAESAHKALAMLERHYDMLFVDIGLPDMSGFDLIKVIRKEISNKIPVIALTGFSEEKELKRCLAAGAAEVATKPISSAELGRILSQYISHATTS